ncbi:unnamed protein product, partial [Rotaria magnacalcarata]
NLWQVDIPIIICNDTIEQTDTSREENNQEPEVISKNFIVNTNIVE